MRKVYLRYEKLFVLRKLKETFFGFGAFCMKEFYEGISLINIGTSYLFGCSNISVMGCFFSKLHTRPFLPKSLSKMRQDNAFSLENVYFKTYEVPMSNDYTCASVNLKHFSVR